jgi:hypothetical protein
MEIVVDDRTFVIGLCELYRQHMKDYEVASLLPLAETACQSLKLPPASVPIEGYYAESDQLKRYFQLIRALQQTEMREMVPGTGLEAVQRLREVFSAPAMGRVEASDKILPRTHNPFGEALRVRAHWTIDSLSAQARQLVRDDDAGLVAVAATTGDPVALCAARESMALMADLVYAEAEVPHFTWAVSETVARIARRFVAALTEATSIVLPQPEAVSAHLYGQAAREAQLPGRCIAIGEQSGNPYRYYHWYIDTDNGRLTVKDFWSSSIWTTENLRVLPVNRWPATGTQVEALNSGDAAADNGNLLPRDAPNKDHQQGLKGWITSLFR